MGADIYDGSRMRVAVILTEKDRENIANMEPGAKVYGTCPKDSDRNAFTLWVMSIRNKER